MKAPLTDTCIHDLARLLPWFVNDTLPVADARQVAAHLEDCPRCRADAAALGQVRSLLRAPAQVEYTPQAGLKKLLARIDEAERADAAAPARAAARRGPGGPVRWLAAAVVVQAVALTVIAATLLGGRTAAGDAANYQTLTAGATDSAALRVVFAPTMTLAEVQDLLRTHQLTAVAGPSEAGLFTLALQAGVRHPEGQRTVLARLRSDPRVRFAEPVGPDPAAR